MEQQTQLYTMLDMMLRPGFCVRDGVIVRVNQAAGAMALGPGVPVASLLRTGAEEYRALTDGCLYLTLALGPVLRGASVTRLEEADLFVLDLDAEEAGLRAMALAARELREPLSSVLLTMDALRALPEDPATRQLLGKMNQGLYQLTRIVGNMSDASAPAAQQQTRNVTRVLAEIFQKAQVLLAQAGHELLYTGPSQDLYSLLNAQLLERAVLNILSNAVKFAPPGGAIQATLTRRDQTLRLTIADQGPGIADGVRGSLFSRYLRQGGLEDVRWGIGLGMLLVRSAAAEHGGAVLVDRAPDGGARVTLTMQLRQLPDTMLRSPTLQVDYTGERDHALVELSDCLPASVYENI